MNFTIFSILMISLIGTISHFLYDMSNHNKVIGLFAAVNESVWEHIKIALTPTILWSLIDALIYSDSSNYFLAKLLSLLTIIIVIPLLFYGYNAVVKKNVFIINIVIFYASIILSQLVFKYIIGLGEMIFAIKYFSCIGLFIIFGGYMIHTLMPAKTSIFKDPITKKYGYKGHTDNKEH